MAEIDGSITAGIGRNTPNPFGQIGEIAGAINQLNQNKLFQARQAQGEAYQRAVGPDGRLDENALMRGVANDPRAALLAGETATASQGRQMQQIEMDGAQLTQHITKLGQINQVLFPLAAKGANVSTNDITQALGYLVSTKVLTPQEALKEAQTIPAEPGAAQQYVMDHLTNGLDQEGKLKMVGMGTPTPMTFGDHTVLVRLSNNPQVPTSNAVTGAPIEQADLQQRLTPEALASRVSGVNPQTGQPFSAPQSALVTPTGQPKASALTGPNGEITTGLQPGEETVRTASAAQLAADRAAMAGAQGQAVALRKVYDLLPTTNTGPGVEATNRIRSFLHSQVPILDKLIPGFDERKIDTANTDELKKYMTQMAGAAAAQYGAGTNEKLAIAASGNPNPELSNLANRDVTRMNIALLRAQQAKLAAFEASGRAAQDYGKFAAEYARTVDPRAFMLDLLTKAERQKVLSGINTEAEKRAFLAGKRAAEQAGQFSEADIPK